MSDDHGPWGAPPAQAPTPTHERRRLVWILVIALSGLALVFAFSRLFPQPLSDNDRGYIGYYVVFLAAVSSSLLVRGVRILTFLRAIAIWGALIAAIVLGYSFRDDLLGLGQRLAGELSPATPVKSGPGEVTITQSAGGEYLATVIVNGRPVRFVIDTGASDIVLTPADARRVGVHVDALAYDRYVETASGADRAAQASVSSLSIGDLRLGPTKVSVNRAPMSASLLGMAFLRRLDSFAFKDHHLVMRGPVHAVAN